ncbi:MAG: VOC family protein, partial [Myxococcota bacterium]
LGLSVYREFGEGPGRGVVFFLGGGFLEVSGSSEEAGTGATRIWLQVRDLEATWQTLTGHGVPIDEGPVEKPWGLHEMHVRDPDDRILVFVEVPPDHPLRRDPRSF